MNMYISSKKCVFGAPSDASLGYNVNSLTKTAGYGDYNVSRDPVVAVVVRWAIIILTAVLIIGFVQSFGFMMPWETGSTIAADAGTIVYLSGNDVMVSIVAGNDTDKISSISLYFESTGDQVNVANVQPTIRSGEPIQIEGMAYGCSGQDNIVLEAQFEGGTTKVLSKTHIEFT